MSIPQPVLAGGRGASCRVPSVPVPSWRPTTAPAGARFLMTCVLASVLAMLLVLVPADVFDPLGDTFLLSIGIIGVWRYSWWSVHAVRAWTYLRFRFPKIRSAVDAANVAKASHVYCLVTSYAIDPGVTWPVYAALFRELSNYGQPATVIAAVSHQTDVDVLRQVADDVGLPAHVEVVFMFQEGTGKRPAMAEALRAISRRLPDDHSVCIFMDGDVLLRDGALSQVLPVLQSHPNMGAATTDNRGITTGGSWAREWYDLRFAQRHLLMSSMSLSGRLLVLTGRFSVIKAELATDPSFIEQLEHDAIEHWRLGRIRFLSGDDKSTWYWLLKRGWGMIYVPDARADSFEELPSSTLLAGAVALLKRWYGNMLRTSDRAIGLGPRAIGLFTWWCLVDQKLSMWTSQVGPVLAIILSIAYGPEFLLVYALWIGGTRTILTIVLGGMLRHRWAPHWPFLLFFNQVLGGLIKTFVSFRLNRQKWTRQEIGGSAAAAGTREFSTSLHALTVAGFVSLLLFYSGAVGLPSVATISTSFAESFAHPPEGDGGWLRQALVRLPEGQTLAMRRGTFRLDRDIASLRPGRVLLGHGSETVVALSPPADAAGRASIWCPRSGPVPGPCTIGRPDAITLRGLTVETTASAGNAASPGGRRPD
ncbi:MAG: glycosyltransferase [Thalassobaculum sp.]|uniref:glycosyltransferase n=1 Tax=Thalassobaculum sp. TaxID=2022740 RepID=UPI0032EDBC69